MFFVQRRKYIHRYYIDIDLECKSGVGKERQLFLDTN